MLLTERLKSFEADMSRKAAIKGEQIK
jgi:chromosome segregation ATPase